MSIRQKLTIMMLSVGLLPAIIISLTAYITASNGIANKTVKQISSVANHQADRITASLLSQEAEEAKVSNSYVFATAYSNFLAKPDEASKAVVTDFLSQSKASTKDIDSIAIADLKGRVRISLAPEEEGTQLQAADYLATASGQGTVLTLKQDPLDHLYKTYVTAELDVNAQRVGVMVAKFSLSSLSSIVADYSGLGETGETIVAKRDDHGNAISLFALRSDPSAAFKTNVNSLQLNHQDEATYENLRDYKGRSVFAATHYIPTVNWEMATIIDRSEALAPVYAIRTGALIVLGAILITMSLLAYFVSRVFTVPIRVLTDRSREIAMGNLRQRITINSHDEIGTLAGAFNTMADQLASSYRALEEKVNQRTLALNQKVNEIAAAKAKDDAILSSIGEGLIVTDTHNIILLSNPIAIDLLNLPTSDVLGKPLSDFPFHDDTDTPLPQALTPAEQALKTSRSAVQTIMVVQDGAKRLLSVTATPVLQNREPIGVIQIIRDITKEREVDRMKTEFISLASHQLRTPLSAIKWFGEMLIGGDAGPLNPEQTEFAQNISSSTQRMIDLVNSLLNISRIESGRILIAPKLTDLNELVSGIVNDLKAKTEQKRQTLVVSIHSELPKVSIDPQLIGQVYLNLLTNAIKYTPGGGTISVMVSRSGDQLVSQVTDNGYGIPKAEQAKVFQKFFRAENAVKVETDGTGLGLYLIKAILDSSGGKIWFESEPGKGTTFWFTLPMSGMKAKKGEVTIDG